ncbi:hypothetical protein MCAP1_000254 [Malassezia caprae]|uniref:Uncharacterized protein n=1 Tax=Malassezia caprae TaxID=1381934 RepID=A0AAF0E239_9BASI|nr:hypothetical protein MCAP1_000254 [Malassezia caprae]
MASERSWREQLQQRYGDQGNHGAIAGPDVVLSAKRKREQMRREAARRIHAQDSDDFIPLDAPRPGSSQALERLDAMEDEPHPESRLLREEDEVGSGEDEFAEFTGATERIPLGRQADRKKKLERRRHMKSLIASVEGTGGSDPDDEADIAIVVRKPRMTTAQPVAGPSATTHIYDEDAFEMRADALPAQAHAEQEHMDEDMEDQDAWERAQLSRMDSGARPTRPDAEAELREVHVPAAVPRVSALPTPTSCLARLEARKAELDSEASEHAKLAQDAQTSLQAIEEEEATLKSEAEELEGRSAWFTELYSFVETVAAFLDAKMPLLETLEHNTMALLADRTVTRQRARMQAMEDDIALVYGVSPTSLWVPRTGAAQHVRLVDADGAWNSPVRQARARTAVPPDTSVQWLSAEEQGSFTAAKEELYTQHAHVMADVQALEFQDPAADTPGALVQRFGEWRSRFPKEYDLAWGGLALANTWDFWARYELALWDPGWCMATEPGTVVLRTSPSGLDGFAWEAGLSAYVDRASVPQGGDDEALATLVSSAVVPRLMTLAELGAYDPFSTEETQAVLALCEQVSYLLDPQQRRFQSLIQAYMDVFASHVQALGTVLRAPPTIPGAPMHPDVPRARQRIAAVLCGLAGNLLRWAVYYVGAHALPWSASEGGAYEALAEDLLSLVHAELAQVHACGGAAELVTPLLALWPSAVAPNVRHSVLTLA